MAEAATAQMQTEVSENWWIPLVQGIREGGDFGHPVALDEEGISGKIFRKLAQTLVEQVDLFAVNDFNTSLLYHNKFFPFMHRHFMIRVFFQLYYKCLHMSSFNFRSQTLININLLFAF